MTTYSFSQLEALWVQAGGSQATAGMAAAIAMAESGGNSTASHGNTNGSIDRGLWQINSIWGTQSTFDPVANARAAVSISKGGTNWRPWCTAWSNGACGGTFLGAGSPVLKYASANGVPTTAANAGDASTGQTSTTVGNPLQDLLNPLDPNTWVQAIFKPLAVWGFYGVMFIVGVAVMLWGFWVLVMSSRTAETAEQAILGITIRSESGGGSRPAPQPAPRPTSRPASRPTSRPASRSTSKAIGRGRSVEAHDARTGERVEAELV